MYVGKFVNLIVTESPSISDVLGKGIGIIFLDPVTILSFLKTSFSLY